MPKYRPFPNTVIPASLTDGGRALNPFGEWCSAARPYLGTALLTAAVVAFTYCGTGARAADQNNSIDGGVASPHNPTGSAVDAPSDEESFWEQAEQGEPLTLPVSGLPIVCRNGICTVGEAAVRKLDFGHSRFAMPPAEAEAIPEPECMADCKAYAMLYYGLPMDEACAVVDRLWAALQQHPDLDFEAELAFLTAAVRFESHGREQASGPAGERGILQCHPCHRRSMSKCGLSFDNADDRLTYCMTLLLERGHQPWSVRRKAESEARRILGGDQ